MTRNGYVILADPDKSPENKAEALANLMKISLPKDDRFKPSWIAKLPDIFRENGLMAVECDAKDPPPEMIMPFHEASMLVYENLTRQAKDSEWSKAIRKACQRLRVRPQLEHVIALLGIWWSDKSRLHEQERKRVFVLGMCSTNSCKCLWPRLEWMCRSDSDKD
ncbi:hypothetical protein N7513_009405 [Penicillium frequentans]|nr:hypothetical protein N7513_009405 [Penicillium glabrum]